MTERPGRFVTFEGVDGSGKTTQMRLLAARLRVDGHHVLETVEPGGTSVGLQIRKILLDRNNTRLCPTAEMFLYFAARAQNFDEIILPGWNDGAFVLSDRFTDSTLAYQGAGRGLAKNAVLTLHDIACHGLQPDLTVCLDLPAEVAMERAVGRGAKDRIEGETSSFHIRVREAYLQLAAEQPERIRLINGQGTMSEVAERVWAVVAPLLRLVR